VSLTAGTGPFGHHPKGRLNFDPPERVVYVEPWPRRVRALAGENVVVDSERTVLVHESGRLPRYAFPAEDVSVEAEAEPELEGYVQVPWSRADRWLEEDEEVIVHPHDPYHRIEVLSSSRNVRVRIGGELFAESTRPRILFETSLPPRYYLPREDIRMGGLEPSDLRTGCAYKGWATYWDATTSTGLVPAVAWSYLEPMREGEPIRDLLCFFQERQEIEVEIDGVEIEYAQTAWSGTEWIARAVAGLSPQPSRA
jgi:uncharacterized protein (DUF427 family)